MKPITHICSFCRESWSAAEIPCFNCRSLAEDCRVPIGGSVVSQSTQSHPELAEHQEFYGEIFGFEFDASNVYTPFDGGVFDRAIVIAQELTLNKIIQVYRNRFKVLCGYADLDAEIIHNDPRPEGTRIVRFRDRIEADEELKWFSADQLRKQGIDGNLLKERLVFGLWQHWSTRTHLDVNSTTTLCSGSRFRKGFVPCVRWDHGELKIQHCQSGYLNEDLRSREVVSS